MEGSKINSILTIEYMCNEKENQFFDRKSAKKDIKELANHIAGFANASGGTLVIGISDDGKLEGFEECPEQVKIIELDRHEISFEEQLNTRSSVNDIDLDMVEIYKNAINADEQELLDILRARRFLIKDDITKKECLTNAGTLLFAKDPSLFFPTARVRVIKFEGKEMQTGADLNIVKDKTFAMPLYKQIKESQKFVDTQLREFTHLGTDGEFVTVPEYPKFAWEERNN